MIKIKIDKTVKECIELDKSLARYLKSIERLTNLGYKFIPEKSLGLLIIYDINNNIIETIEMFDESEKALLKEILK